MCESDFQLTVWLHRVGRVDKEGMRGSFKIEFYWISFISNWSTLQSRKKNTYNQKEISKGPELLSTLAF